MNAVFPKTRVLLLVVVMASTAATVTQAVASSNATAATAARSGGAIDSRVFTIKRGKGWSRKNPSSPSTSQSEWGYTEEEDEDGDDDYESAYIGGDEEDEDAACFYYEMKLGWGKVRGSHLAPLCPPYESEGGTEDEDDNHEYYRYESTDLGGYEHLGHEYDDDAYNIYDDDDDTYGDNTGDNSNDDDDDDYYDPYGSSYE